MAATAHFCGQLPAATRQPRSNQLQLSGLIKSAGFKCKHFIQSLPVYCACRTSGFSNRKGFGRTFCSLKSLEALCVRSQIEKLRIRRTSVFGLNSNGVANQYLMMKMFVDHATKLSAGILRSPSTSNIFALETLKFLEAIVRSSRDLPECGLSGKVRRW